MCLVVWLISLPRKKWIGRGGGGGGDVGIYPLYDCYCCDLLDVVKLYDMWLGASDMKASGGPRTPVGLSMQVSTLFCSCLPCPIFYVYM